MLDLHQRFEMFVVTEEMVDPGFHDAMRRFQATYLWRDMPRPYQNCRAVFLPRSDSRSMKIAVILREAGFFDLGVYLHKLIARQSRIAN